MAGKLGVGRAYGQSFTLGAVGSHGGIWSEGGVITFAFWKAPLPQLIHRKPCTGDRPGGREAMEEAFVVCIQGTCEVGLGYAGGGGPSRGVASLQGPACCVPSVLGQPLP